MKFNYYETTGLFRFLGGFMTLFMSLVLFVGVKSGEGNLVVIPLFLIPVAIWLVIRTFTTIIIEDDQVIYKSISSKIIIKKEELHGIELVQVVKRGKFSVPKKYYIPIKKRFKYDLSSTYYIIFRKSKERSSDPIFSVFTSNEQKDFGVQFRVPIVKALQKKGYWKMIDEQGIVLSKE